MNLQAGLKIKYKVKEKSIWAFAEMIYEKAALRVALLVCHGGIGERTGKSLRLHSVSFWEGFFFTAGLLGLYLHSVWGRFWYALLEGEMSHVVCWVFWSKYIFSFVFSADDEQMSPIYFQPYILVIFAWLGGICYCRSWQVSLKGKAKMLKTWADKMLHGLWTWNVEYNFQWIDIWE